MILPFFYDPSKPLQKASLCDITQAFMSKMFKKR